jgi:hypothetical protein
MASCVKSNGILSPGLCISLLFQSLSKSGQQTEFGIAHRRTRFTAVKATAKPRVRLAHLHLLARHLLDLSLQLIFHATASSI